MDSSPSQQTFLSKFLKGGAWSLFVRTFAELSTLLISMIIARMLAPEQVGVYFLISSMVSVLVVFSLFGLNITVVRLISAASALSKGGEVRDTIVKSRWTVLASSLCVALFLYFIGLQFLAEQVFDVEAIYDLRLLIVIWLVLWTLESLNAEIFRGFQQFHLAVMFKRFAPNALILVISAAVFIANIEVDLHKYLGIVLFGWLCSVIVSSLLLRNRFQQTTGEGEMPLGQLLSTSLPLWFTGFITFTLPRLDLWVLAAFDSAAALAQYGAATRLAYIISVPLFVIQAVIPALIAEAHSQDRKREMERGLRSAAALAFYPAAVLCAIYFVFADYILGFVFGEYYQDAAIILKILTIGTLVRTFAASSQSVLTMTGHGKAAMMISIFSGAVMVLACIYAGQNYGMTGVAVAASSGISLQYLLNFLFARKYVGIWILPIINVSTIRQFFNKK